PGGPLSCHGARRGGPRRRRPRHGRGRCPPPSYGMRRGVRLKRRRPRRRCNAATALPWSPSRDTAAPPCWRISTSAPPAPSRAPPVSRHAAPGGPPPAVLLTPWGGLAGGARLKIEAQVGAGAAATLTSQAAEKIYRSLGPAACVTVTLSVDADGWLEYLPQET